MTDVTATYHAWNYLNKCKKKKKSSGLFKIDIYKMSLQIIYIYLIYIYKQDLALNNLPCLICHKAQQTKLSGLFGFFKKKKPK